MQGSDKASRNPKPANEQASSSEERRSYLDKEQQFDILAGRRRTLALSDMLLLEMVDTHVWRFERRC